MYFNFQKSLRLLNFFKGGKNHLKKTPFVEKIQKVKKKYTSRLIYLTKNTNLALLIKNIVNPAYIIFLFLGKT